MQSDTQQIKPRRYRYAAKTAPVASCSICSSSISMWDKVARTVTFEGETFDVCGTCRRRYQDPCRQIGEHGFRFRFVRRSEIPKNETHPGFAEVYKTFLLIREQELLRQKEVKWMAIDKTQKVLKLGESIGRVLCNTFAVRGDEATTTDEEALTRIRDLIEEIDPEIINKLMRERDRKRNKKKRLP
jgi:hypothetical protein